jgi:hypothetical protein
MRALPFRRSFGRPDAIFHCHEVLFLILSLVELNELCLTHKKQLEWIAEMGPASPLEIYSFQKDGVITDPYCSQDPAPNFGIYCLTFFDRAAEL